MRGSKRQVRDGTWELRVYLGTDPVTGRRKQISRRHHGSARSADRALSLLVAEVVDGRKGPETDATFGHLLSAWLDLASRDLSVTTISTYRSYAANRIEPDLGDVPLRKLTAAHLDRLYVRLSAEGLAPATVRQVHAICRRALRQGVRWGWVVQNVAEHATPPPVRRTDVQTPDPVLALKVIGTIEEHDPDMGVALRVLATTGCRRGELCALRWSSLNLNAGELTVSESVAERDAVTVKGTKTHQVRKIALDPGTVDLLKAHRVRVLERARIGMVTVPDRGFVFSPEIDGSVPRRPSSITGVWRRCAQSLGVDMRLHDLRHLMASLLLDAGVPAIVVAGRLGHAQTSTTTNIYGHRLTGADRQVADQIAQLLGGTHE